MTRNGKRTLGIKILFRLALIAVAAALILTVVSNTAVCLSTRDRIRSVEDSMRDTGYDCIIVLGCAVWGDEPSKLLSGRLDAAIALYRAGVAPKLLMSGDHGRKDYDEVSAMRKYAMEQGVPSEDIFMDHAGFSTYETMYRARDIFGIERAVIVTQEYHLYRALYDAAALGMEVTGTAAGGQELSGQRQREAREILARTKDFIWCVFKPEPTYRGEKIDIRGNGESTLG